MNYIRGFLLKFNFMLFSVNRFVGYDSESKQLDADQLRRYIFGGHVADYMRYLSEEDPEKYQKQFSAFIKEGISADGVSII